MFFSGGGTGRNLHPLQPSLCVHSTVISIIIVTVMHIYTLQNYCIMETPVTSNFLSFTNQPMHAIARYAVTNADTIIYTLSLSQVVLSLSHLTPLSLSYMTRKLEELGADRHSPPPPPTRVGKRVLITAKPRLHTQSNTDDSTTQQQTRNGTNDSLEMCSMELDCLPQRKQSKRPDTPPRYGKHGIIDLSSQCKPPFSKCPARRPNRTCGAGKKLYLHNASIPK